jgi:predicted choloylglycine hydrolase
MKMKFIAFAALFLTIASVSQPIYDSRRLIEVTLSGTGYELGFQHGEKLKREVEAVVRTWKKNTEIQLGRDANTVLEEFMAYQHFDEAIKKWTPELYEEIRGIADGSGQRFEDILVLNLLDEFWVYLEAKNHHCSGMGVPARNGNPGYISQNMDLEEYIDQFQTLIRLSRTNDRPEQLILTHPGLIALNGLNEKGVGVCVNTLMQLKASPAGLPVAFVVRRIINSTDKRELLEFIQNVPHASGQNYIIGIRGEVYDFEASANKVVRFNPKNANGSVYHTNHPIVNDDIKPGFEKFSPTLAENQQAVNSNSFLRLAAVEKRMTANAAIDSEAMKEALRSRDDKNNPVCNANNGTGRGFTFASVVMTFSDHPFLEITAGPPDESDYKKVEFSKK